MSILTSGSSSYFRNRVVQTILLSTIFLQIGIWVRNFALLLFVMEQANNSPFAVSLISVAEYAPLLIFSFVGGTFADRWRPKHTMVWCDLLSALSVFVILITIIFASWEVIFFVTFISAVLSQFSQPSVIKLFKIHVPSEQVQFSMSFFQTLNGIFMIVGPMLGTFVYQKFGINIAVGIMGIAFLLSAGVLSFLPQQRNLNECMEKNFWQELSAGFRYVWSKKVLTVLGCVFFLAGLAGGLVQTLMVFVVMENLNLPKESVQWLMMVNGGAMLVGGGLMMGLANRVSPQKLLALGLGVNAIASVGMGLSTSWPLTIALQFFNGLFIPCLHIGVSTLIFLSTEESFLGRVNGVLNPLFLGAMVISMSLAGWLKAKLSLMLLYELAGVLLVVAVLLIVPLFNNVVSRKNKITHNVG